MSRILSMGLNLVDFYLDDGLMYPGGNELNVSVYVSRLGGNAAFLGTFGTDESATTIKKVLENEKIDYSRCRTRNGESGNSIVKIVDGDRVFIGYNNGGVTGKYPLELDSEDIEYAKQFNVVTSSVYGRVPAVEIVKLCKAGIPVAYDFSNDWEKDVAEYLLPHLAFSFFSCAEKTDGEVESILSNARELGCIYPIATLGSRGSISFDGENYVSQSIFEVKAVDTMGAGDSYIAAFLNEFFNENPSEKRLQNAMSAGARFAAETCIQSGAIGYSETIPEGYEIVYKDMLQEKEVVTVWHKT